MAEKMVWVDIETTGLSAQEDRILELGLTITDKWGEILDFDSWLVGVDDNFYQQALNDAARDPVVGPMHVQNGLFHEWNLAMHKEPVIMHPDQVTSDALALLDYNEIRFGEYPMCGASVQLDREFIREQMPKLFQHFSYRNIDISTVRALADMLNPGIGRAQKETFDSEGFIPHRVLSDLRWSIHEYKHYVENFFFISGE